MFQLSGSLQKYPARVSVVVYLALIVAGAVLLRLPHCHSSQKEPVVLVDALFTSTSAVCVTGLAVRSTEHDFSFWGQLMILLLIQAGGIGMMTLTTFVVFELGGHASLRQRIMLAESLGAQTTSDLPWILRNVISFTIIAEGLGAAILAARNCLDYPPATALWHGVFHSVSAFCNAGFALHDDSLSRYQGDPLVNLTIMILIVLGGIGFPVVLDIRRSWHRSWRELWDQLQVHSKLMLIGTTSLIVGGAVAVLLLEWRGVLAEMPIWQRPLAALFHSVSSRTAGFNTVDIAAMTNATLFLTILLMLIGAGPCSTGGGLKVSTMMVLLVQARSAFAGRLRVSVFRRSVPPETVQRATVTTILFIITVFVALSVLLVIEQSGESHLQSGRRFLDAFFEIVSAIGTVGLSTGITPDLSAAGKLVVILVMFLGRLGPISVFAALSRSLRSEPIEYPQTSVLIG